MSAPVRIDGQPDALVGTVLADRYLVLEQLGEGGMARVYGARHLGLDKRVAIKVLAPKHDLPDAAARFMREARMMADLDHPNVARVTDFGATQDGRLYLVMEHVDGDDLAAALEKVGRMPWRRVRRIMLQVASALGSAHARGIVHRDVKPENVLCVAGEDDVVKVIDFGIARVASAAEEGLTRVGSLFGTPEYMAPEQSRSTKVDHRADVYSLGIVAYELLTGAPPFTGDDFMELLWKQASEPIVPPSQVVPGMDPDADAFIMHACAKDPAERFQTMEEMVAFLWGKRKPAKPTRSVAPIVAGAALAGVAAIVAVAIFVGEAPSVGAETVESSPPVAIPLEPAQRLAVAPEEPASEPEPEPESEPAPTPESAAPAVEEAEPAPTKSQPRVRSRVLRAVQPGVSACVGEIMGGKPNDKVQVRFVLASNGHVQSARAVGEHAGTALGKCVTAAAKQASFPAGPPVTFTHTFKL